MRTKWQALAWVPFPFVLFTGCSQPSQDFSRRVPAVLKKECNVTALVNGKVWIGNATASYNGDSCLYGKPISIWIWTDLLAGQAVNMDEESINTTCADSSRVNRSLSFLQIPLKVGKYRLSDFEKCLPKVDMWTGGHYSLWGGYDGEYYLSGATTQKKGAVVKISGPDDSWLEITRYDREKAQVEDRFEARFRNRKNEEIRFTKASLCTKIVVLEC